MPEERTLLEETEPKDIKKLVKGLEGDFGFVVASVGGMACILLMNQIAPDFQLNSLHFIVGSTFSITFLMVKQNLPKFEKKNVKWLIVIGLFNFLHVFNIGSYSHYLKSITFVGTRSSQECAGIIFALLFPELFSKLRYLVSK